MKDDDVAAGVEIKAQKLRQDEQDLQDGCVSGLRKKDPVFRTAGLIMPESNPAAITSINRRYSQTKISY